MTTITATPGGQAAEIELTITPTDEVIYVYRTDANGTNKVRVRPDVFPRPLSGTELRRNLCPDPSLVLPAGTWAATRATLSATPVAGSIMPPTLSAGNNACKLTPLATGTAFAQLSPEKRLPVTPGRWVGLSAAIAPIGAGSVGIMFYNASGGWVGESWSEPTTTPKRVSVAASVPVGATAVGAAFRSYSAAIGIPAVTDFIICDGINLAMATTQSKVLTDVETYFDGATADTDTIAYRWTGTAYGSESTEVSAAPFTISDYEPAHGIVNYVVMGRNGSVWSETAVSTAFVMDTPWLSVPTMQTLSRPVASVLTYDSLRDTRSTIIDIPGRTDPVVVLRAMGTRRGQLEIFTGTHAEATAIISLCDRGEVLMLRQPEHMGMDMYFTALSASVRTLQTKGAESVFSVILRYVETRFPGGALLTAPGWSFAELAASNASFKAVSTKFRDFQAVAENKPTAGA